MFIHVEHQLELGITKPDEIIHFKVPRGRPKKLKKGGRRPGTGRPRKSTQFGSTDIQSVDDSESDRSSAVSSRASTPSSTPVRRSPRMSSPASTTSTTSSATWSKFTDVTDKCHTTHSKHFGIFCGAQSAKHQPVYYNTLAQVFIIFISK